MLVGVNVGGREQLFSMDLDGTRIAFHADYSMHTARIDGSDHVAVAGRKG